MHEEDEVKNLPMFARIADIKARNNLNRGNFDDETYDNAATIEVLARSAYPRSQVYVNFRKGSIMVKVDTVTRADRLQSVKQIDELNEFVDLYNAEVVQLAGHLLIHLRDGDTV